MIKSRKQMFIVVGAFALVMLLGTVTYAFFNYTRTGTANTIRTGRISFNANQDGNINLTNAFPITSSEAETDTTNAKSVAITVTGDTDYADGLEYLVTASDVNLTVGSGQSAKTLPIALEVSVSDNVHGEEPNQTTTTLGTAETGNYYANRSSYTVSKYKILYDGELEEDARILVGYIAPNTTTGTPSGIDGTINIKAYIDSSKILISDTYPSGDVDTNNDNETDYTNGTPASMGEGKVVFTTTEWNGIQESPLSFKVKVESNEGIWVKEPTAAQVISKVEGLEEIAGAKRYIGANPNNYVIFNNEQWRIIGVYGENLKIIRATSLSQTRAYDADSNVWDGSDLEIFLNGDYYNGVSNEGLSETSRNMISPGIWNAGEQIGSERANDAYSAAVLTRVSNKKVGLIATYEYLYAAGESCRTMEGANSLYPTTCALQNWLKPNSNMWTINPATGGYGMGDIYVKSDGLVNGIIRSSLLSVSPVAYLNSAVTITGGTGEPGGNEYTLSYMAN